MRNMMNSKKNGIQVNKMVAVIKIKEWKYKYLCNMNGQLFAGIYRNENIFPLN